jgi:hypothetical protein
MGDNIDVTPGSGVTIAGDEVSRNAVTELQQVVKIGVGHEGEHVGFFGAADIYRDIDIDETGIQIKGSPGLVFCITAINLVAADRFLKLYNIVAAPTVGTTVPVITIPLPENVPITISVAAGIEFDTGIGIGCTTGVADADTGAPGANDVIVNVFYK